MDLVKLCEAVDQFEPFCMTGKVRGARGQVLSCTLPAAVGDMCEVIAPGGSRHLAEVIGFAQDVTHLSLFEAVDVHPGMPVVRLGRGTPISVGKGLLGRVLDGLGRPVDQQGPLVGCRPRTARFLPPRPLDRQRIRDVFVTGQRAIDGLLTCGRGQRLGIFSGSGVGKSTLLGEIAKHSAADLNVIALVGERGREVRPFLEDCLGPEGMRKSVVLLATCEQTPLMRIRAAQTALTIADHFRDGGAHVLFLCDSLTRLAMAQRELGLSLGEPPSARSYTPSVFQLLANLVEGMGNADRGSITGILTVLVEGGDMDEPIADAVRSLVDGHIVLDRTLAELGQYPAIHVRQSVSRVAHEVADAEQVQASRKITALLATHAEVEDLVRIGAYARGSSPQVDKALELRPKVVAFLKQKIDERSSFADTRAGLLRLAAQWPF